MELAGYVAILRRWWWTLLLAAWIAGLVGYLFATSLPPSYEARTRLLVGPVSADLNTLRSSAGLVPTFAELATSQGVLEAVIADLGLDQSLDELSDTLSVTANDTTRIMTIRYDGTDPQLVADVPNAVAAELIALQPTGSVLPEGEITVIEEAAVPDEPSAPDVPLLVTLAAIAGTVGALMLVLLLEYMNHAIRDGKEVEELTGLPLLGTLRPPSPRARRGGTSPLYVESFPTSRATAVTHVAAIQATAGSKDRPVKSLLVLGVEATPGSGQIAVNLAAVVAQGGQRVTVVDANDRSAETTALMAAVDLPGLSDLLAAEGADNDDAELERVILSRWAGIKILPAGSGPPRAVSPERARAFVSRLEARNDLAIVTAAPIHTSGSALVWARACDATILVARRDSTKREALVEVVESLRLVGANPTGVILYERPSSFVVPASAPPKATPAPLRPQAVATSPDAPPSQPDASAGDAGGSSAAPDRRRRARSSRGSDRSSESVGG